MDKEWKQNRTERIKNGHKEGHADSMRERKESGDWKKGVD